MIKQGIHIISLEPINKRPASNSFHEFSMTSLSINVIGAFWRAMKRKCTRLRESKCLFDCIKNSQYYELTRRPSPFRVHSNLQFIRCELLCDFFSLCNCKKWIHNSLFDLSVQVKVDQIAKIPAFCLIYCNFNLHIFHVKLQLWKIKFIYYLLKSLI